MSLNYKWSILGYSFSRAVSLLLSGNHLERTPKPVTSYNYPQISKNFLHIQSQDRITRLTKSAESLRGMSKLIALFLTRVRVRTQNCCTTGPYIVARYIVTNASKSVQNGQKWPNERDLLWKTCCLIMLYDSYYAYISVISVILDWYRFFRFYRVNFEPVVHRSKTFQPINSTKSKFTIS